MSKLCLLIPAALYLALLLHVATVTAEDSVFSSFSQLSSLSSEFKNSISGGKGSPAASPTAAEGPSADSPAPSPGSKFSLNDLGSMGSSLGGGFSSLAKDFKSKMKGAQSPSDADAPGPSGADAPGPAGDDDDDDDDDSRGPSDADDASAPNPSSDSDAPSPSPDSDSGSPSISMSSTSKSKARSKSMSTSTTEVEANPLTSSDDHK